MEYFDAIGVVIDTSSEPIYCVNREEPLYKIEEGIEFDYANGVVSYNKWKEYPLFIGDNDEFRSNELFIGMGSKTNNYCFYYVDSRTNKAEYLEADGNGAIVVDRSTREIEILGSEVVYFRFSDLILIQLNLVSLEFTYLYGADALTVQEKHDFEVPRPIGTSFAYYEDEFYEQYVDSDTRLLNYENTCCTTFSKNTIIVPKECRYFEIYNHIDVLVLNQELEYVFIDYGAFITIEEIYIWKNASVRLVNSLISSLARNLRLDEEDRLYTVRAKLLSKKLNDLEFYAECHRQEYKELIDEAFKHTSVIVY
jgi:hypothetical protein